MSTWLLFPFFLSSCHVALLNQKNTTPFFSFSFCHCEIQWSTDDWETWMKGLPWTNLPGPEMALLPWFLRLKMKILQPLIPRRILIQKWQQGMEAILSLAMGTIPVLQIRVQVGVVLALLMILRPPPVVPVIMRIIMQMAIMMAILARTTRLGPLPIQQRPYTTRKRSYHTRDSYPNHFTALSKPTNYDGCV